MQASKLLYGLQIASRLVTETHLGKHEVGQLRFSHYAGPNDYGRTPKGKIGGGVPTAARHLSRAADCFLSVPDDNRVDH